MTTLDLLHEFEQLGVSIWREGDALKFDAPTGTMTPERINLLKQHKPDLLAFLSAGNAATIEPLEHRNDAHELTGLQQRALNGLIYLIDRKRQSLIKGGYAPDNALVTREEWRTAVKRTLNLNHDRMDKLETELYQVGAIGYEASRLYVVVGDWQTQTHAYKDNPDFMLSDDTGRMFCNWLYH
jgi:hypothetical protein